MERWFLSIFIFILVYGHTTLIVPDVRFTLFLKLRVYVCVWGRGGGRVHVNENACGVQKSVLEPIKIAVEE